MAVDSEKMVVVAVDTDAGVDDVWGKRSVKAVSTPSIADGIFFSFAGSPSEKAMAIRIGNGQN